MTPQKQGRDEHVFVVGYVCEAHSTDLKYSKKAQIINQFCKKQDYTLIFTEQEAGAPKNMCRPGLWRVTRALVCYQCEPEFMPVSFDVEAWVQRALTPCRCVEPAGVSGIVISSITTICTDPIAGSKYALALAMARKHLYIADEGCCMSCCNPAAFPFM